MSFLKRFLISAHKINDNELINPPPAAAPAPPPPSAAAPAACWANRVLIPSCKVPVVVCTKVLSSATAVFSASQGHNSDLCGKKEIILIIIIYNYINTNDTEITVMVH